MDYAANYNISLESEFCEGEIEELLSGGKITNTSIYNQTNVKEVDICSLKAVRV